MLWIWKQGKCFGIWLNCVWKCHHKKLALNEGLKHNLLSISQLIDKGYHAKFDDKECSIRNKSMREVILHGIRHGNIYEVSLDECNIEGKI